MGASFLRGPPPPQFFGLTFGVLFENPPKSGNLPSQKKKKISHIYIYI